LPHSHFAAAHAAIEVVEQIELDGRDTDPERYSRRIIERVPPNTILLALN
jgi:hypothetical protein